MANYLVDADCLELAHGSRFVVLAGSPVEPGQLALVKVEGYQLVGRWRSGSLELPGVVIGLGHVSYRVIGPVVPVTKENVYNCRN
jgi:hypothetical protein